MDRPRRRVLWLGHFVPYPPRGGAPQRSYNLLRAVGESVDLHFAGISQRGHQPTPGDVETARHALRSFCSSVEILPLRFRSSAAGKAYTIALSLLKRQSYNETWLETGPSLALVEEAIRRVDPDVIHVDSVMIANLIPRDDSRPAVLNHHNIESQMAERRGSMAQGFLRHYLRREATLLRALERETERRFARHAVVSDLDGRRLQAVAPGARYEVIPNGVDTEFFRPSDVEPVPNSLVFAGRMNWYPNEHAMVRFVRDLWPRLKQRIPSIRLTIAGMNPTSALQRTVADDPAVNVTGFVEDIRETICRSSLYVCPILDGGGTRLKLLDAMALGMPIVATPMAVEGLDVEDGNHLITAELDDDFIDAVVSCLQHDERRGSLGRSARSLSETRYAWRRIACDLNGLYEEVLHETSSAGVHRPRQTSTS